MTKVEDIIQKIEQFAPPHLAEDWDPIGLSIGTRQQKVNKMLVALDLDADTLEEAKAKEVDFIFTHHPAIFSSLKTLNEEDPRRKEYIELIRANISLYSAHTNIDAAENGMNDWLAEAIGLKRPYDAITFSHQDTYKKLTYYAKTQGSTKQKDLIKKELENSPSIHYYHLNQEEMKIEMVLAEQEVPAFIQKLYRLEAEPNYHLTTIDKKAPSYGIGRVGELAEALTMEDLIEKVKSAYSVEHLRSSNMKVAEPIKKVAVLGGAGANYYQRALAQGAEVYITGDISYHSAQDMMRDGLAFIDPGHFIEHIFVEQMTARLNEWNESENWGIEIIPASQQEDVFTFS